jgi:membrane protein DedA with SNARE-associated domain
MPFFIFLWYTFLGGLVWSGFLTFIGYFYGYLWREIGQYIQWIGWVIGSVSIATLLSIRVFQKYRAKKF